jgi:DNA polymerase-1
MQSMQKHLVIVDGHHLMYRAYWAIPRTMKTSKGEQVNTSFGVASMLLQILKAEEPTHILFCFDAGSETFRHAEYAEYKSGRAETPDDFYVQIPRTLSLIDTFAIKSVSGREHEADDYACAYARSAEAEGFRVTVVSGDRDLLQLASDNIRIAIPHKGYQVPEYLGPTEVLLKYGVTPEQIPSYKALVGDASDNLRGVKGIGPKAAEALIREYGSLAGIYDHLPAIKGAWRSKLEADREQAFFCERMATLVSTIPFTVSVTDLQFSDVNVDPVLSLFQQLEFSLPRRRLESLMQSPYGQRVFVPSSGLASPLPDVHSSLERPEENSPQTGRLDQQLSLL